MDFNQQAIVSVNELEKIGVNSQHVIVLYQVEKGVTLNLNEMIKVSSQDEGKSINFETLDHISIIVSVDNSDGGWNKVE